MSDSPESVVRKFLEAWTNPKAEELRTFLNDDAVWVDGPQGLRRGANVIVDELTRQLAVGRDHTLVVDTLVADGTDRHGGVAWKLLTWSEVDIHQGHGRVRG